jgi:hypothetical protein
MALWLNSHNPAWLACHRHPVSEGKSLAVNHL